jgi:hypothetical protein
VWLLHKYSTCKFIPDIPLFFILSTWTGYGNSQAALLELGGERVITMWYFQWTMPFYKAGISNHNLKAWAVSTFFPNPSLEWLLVSPWGWLLAPEVLTLSQIFLPKYSSKFQAEAMRIFNNPEALVHSSSDVLFLWDFQWLIPFSKVEVDKIKNPFPPMKRDPSQSSCPSLQKFSSKNTSA